MTADAGTPREFGSSHQSDEHRTYIRAKKPRILLVCPYFPPENAIASLRIASFARYWTLAGCEVQVLCRTPLSSGMPVPADPNLIVHRVPDPLGKTSESVGAYVASSGAQSRFRIALRRFKKLVVFPDSFVLWGIRALLYLRLNGIKADVVIGSGGPLSALILAGRISMMQSIPLIIDFRDPIATRPNAVAGLIRPYLLKRIEALLVAKAARVVTVSNRLSAHLRSVYARDFAVVYNGYEPEIFDFAVPPEKAAGLTLVITGTVYPEHSDMRPLFEAIALFRKRLHAVPIRIEHYGPNRSLAALSNWASQWGVQDVLIGHGHVPHSESIQAQLRSDAVVLAAWFEDLDPGNLPGKLFEYLGSGKPIIQVGGVDSEAAELIRLQPHSLVSNDARAILHHLEKLWSSRLSVESEPDAKARFSKFTRERQGLAFLSLIERTLEEAGA